MISTPHILGKKQELLHILKEKLGMWQEGRSCESHEALFPLCLLYWHVLNISGLPVAPLRPLETNLDEMVDNENVVNGAVEWFWEITKSSRLIRHALDWILGNIG